MSCVMCDKQPKRASNKYCSNMCQQAHRYQKYIASWKAGKVNGSRGVNAKNISGHIRRYLAEKYGDSCSICSWSKQHPLTGKVPLEIDHIDGNADNNSESNLRLLCPNCHSLTPNFRNLNFGKGREWRKHKYKKSEQ